VAVPGAYCQRIAACNGEFRGVGAEGVVVSLRQKGMVGHGPSMARIRVAGKPTLVSRKCSMRPLPRVCANGGDGQGHGDVLPGEFVRAGGGFGHTADGRLDADLG
jgi:hypothetical protein